MKSNPSTLGNNTNQVLGFIYASEPLLTFVYIRHMTRLASNGVRNLKVGSSVRRRVLHGDGDGGHRGESTTKKQNNLSAPPHTHTRARTQPHRPSDQCITTQK